MKICSECENFSVDEEGYRRCSQGGCGYVMVSSPVKKGVIGNINKQVIRANSRRANSKHIENHAVYNEEELWYHKM